MFCYSCKLQIQNLTNNISFKLQYEVNGRMKETKGFVSVRTPPLHFNQESSKDCNKLSRIWLFL